MLQLHSVMNLSLRRIQGATNVAKSSGLNIEQINLLNDDELKLKLFPEHASVIVSKKAMPDMNYLYKEMKLRKKTKITLMLLWEEYKENNPIN